MEIQNSAISSSEAAADFFREKTNCRRKPLQFKTPPNTGLNKRLQGKTSRIYWVNKICRKRRFAPLILHQYPNLYLLRLVNTSGFKHLIPIKKVRFSKLRGTSRYVSTCFNTMSSMLVDEFFFQRSFNFDGFLLQLVNLFPEEVRSWSRNCTGIHYLLCST